MKYEILGKTVPVVEVSLNQGESIYTQSGGMSWQTEGIKMKTNARGGVMKSLGRMFVGESIFMSSYKAEVDGAKIAFATTVPGDIIPINMTNNPNGMMIQKKAFLCAEEDVELKKEEKEIGDDKTKKVEDNIIVESESLEVPKALQKNIKIENAQEVSIEKTTEILNQMNQYLNEEKKKLK